MEERIYRVGGRDTRLEQNRSRQVFTTLQARAEGFAHITVPLNALDDTEILLPKTLGAKARTKAELKLLYRALQNEDIDMIQAPVDSLDWNLSDKLTIAAILKRQDPRDVLVIKKDQSFATLEAGARIYSSGLRRDVQIAQLRDDLQIETTELSLEDQLDALETDEISAVICSAADLVAIGMESYRNSLSFRPFALNAMVPKAGQGLIAVICRRTDTTLRKLLEDHLEDTDARIAYNAEQSCAEALGLDTDEASKYYGALMVFAEKDELYIQALSQKSKPALVRQRLNRSGEKTADPALIEAALQGLLGSTTFVGVDSYDPELVAVKANTAIKDATCLIYGRRLRHVVSLYDLPDSMTKIEVADNEDVGRKLLSLNRQGHNCVRLLEGDPFIYGEAPAEIETLRASSVAVDIVPGSSALLTWPIYAGIPLVYPEVSDQLHIFDGRRFPLQADDPLLKQLRTLDSQSTMLFHMAATRLPNIVASLKQVNFKLSTPAAVIAAGTSMEPQVIEATLEHLPGLVVSENILDPAILVIGDVISRRDALKWWPPLGPMSQMRFMELSTERIKFDPLLIRKTTRHLGASVFSWQLAREERRPYLDDRIASELIAALERKQASRRFERNELWFALDGVGAVDALSRCLRDLKLDHRLLAPVNIAVSDAATAAALEQIGFEADYVSATNDADDMAAHLAGILNPSDFVLGIGSQSGQSVLSVVLQLAEIPHQSLLFAEYIKERPDSTTFLDQLADVDNIVFTDAGAVRELGALLLDLGLDSDELAESGMLFFVTSLEAERMAIARGIPLAGVPSSYTLEPVIELLKSKAKVHES